MKKHIIFLLVIMAAFTSCRQPKDLVYRGVQHFSLKQAELRKTVLTMDVELYNPNSYSMKLKKANLDIYVNNNRMGKVNLGSKLLVPRMATFLMPVNLDVDLANALPNMLQLALQSEVDVKLSGTIKAGRHGIFITVPVNYEGKQDIRSGLKW